MHIALSSTLALAHSSTSTESLTCDGMAANGNDVMLTGQGQAPAAPHAPQRHAEFAHDVGWALEADDLALPQMYSGTIGAPACIAQHNALLRLPNNQQFRAGEDTSGESICY